MGTDATAAYSVTNVATKPDPVSEAKASPTAPAFTLGTLLGQNLFEKAKEYGKRFWIIALLCGFANATLLCVIGPLIYHFYVLEPAAQHYLIQMLAYNVLYMFAYSFNAQLFTLRRSSGRRRCKIRCGQRIDCNVVPGASDLCFGLLCVPLAGHGRLYGHVCR